jgi:hypothetical protein
MPTLSLDGGINFNNSNFDSNFNLPMDYTILLVVDPSQSDGLYYGTSTIPSISSDKEGNYYYQGDDHKIQLSTSYTYGKNSISMVRSNNINTIGYYNGKTWKYSIILS